jgi:carbamoyl-phosphate synthase large subunit
MVHVKAPVFSFSKLNKVDATLGPEMKSTGEVMGSDSTLEKALYKAFEASDMRLPEHGTVLFTVSDEDKNEAADLAARLVSIGYSITATQGTAHAFGQRGIPAEYIEKTGNPEDQSYDILDLIMSGQVNLVVNTMGKNIDAVQDGLSIRKSSIEKGIPLMTSLDTVSAIISVLESRTFTTSAL